MYLDSPITQTGVYQITKTAEWLIENFDLTGWKGVVSPYLRTLQTALILQKIIPDVEFEVDINAGEYHTAGLPTEEGYGVANGELRINSRAIEFPSFKSWHDWYSFRTENFSEFMDRMYHLCERFADDKYVVVTHAAPAHILSEIGMGRSREVITKTIHAFRDVKNSSLTHVDGRNKLCYSKIVYDIEYSPMKVNYG